MNLQGNTPKSYLTLSAQPELPPEDSGSATSIRCQLEAIGQAHIAGRGALAEALTDQLIDYVWTPAKDAISESELRLLDGNR